MDAFHGRLNRISSKTTYDVCIIPMLLYGSENWILTVSLSGRDRKPRMRIIVSTHVCSAFLRKSAEIIKYQL